VVGSDFSEAMLAGARRKATPIPIGFEWGNALELPYDSDRFDAATRRVRGPQLRRPRPGPARDGPRRATRWTRRRPWRSRPRSSPPLSTFYEAWFDRLVPLLGRFDEAYTYLPASVKRFPGPHELAGRMDAAGLERIRYVLTAGGIIAIHVGEKPPAGARPTLAPEAAPHRGGRRPVGTGLLGAVEQRLAEVAAAHGAHLAEHAGRDDRGRRQAPAPAARARRRGRRARRRGGAGAGRGRRRARALGHAGPRRRARRRARCGAGGPTVWASAGRGAATATGDLLFAAAFAELTRNGRADEVRALSRAGSALAAASCCSARTRGAPTCRSSATCTAASSRPRGCSRPPARSGCSRRAAPRRPRRSRASAAASGWPSSCSTTSWTSRARRRTGKHRGTDLLDGTVTLPFILARERCPALAALDLRAW
jgi:hypothetical protein